ncbi:MAG: RNA polymerase sigma-70 factor [Bacteroidales bacterium]|nr:RNA polymerase sigma-70 factor [Bacteroidales bacterium]
MELKERIAAGDLDAFRELFETYFPKVREFIAAFIKDDKSAEDLSQDIFLKIWNMREVLPEVRNVSSWIYRMARNASLNYIRSRKKTAVLTDAALPEVRDTEDIYIEREKELIIKTFVDTMPERRREIFNMSRYQDIPNDKIAEILHISKKTVENHLTLALKDIRNLLGTFIIFF